MLDLSEKVCAPKIKGMCFQFIAKNFELFSDGSGPLSYSLNNLDKDLLVEIIKFKAQFESK